MEYRYHEVRCSHGFLVDSDLCTECARPVRHVAQTCDGRSRVDPEVTERIFQCVVENPGISTAQVAKTLGIDANIVRRSMRSLSMLRRVVSQESRSSYVYRANQGAA